MSSLAGISGDAAIAAFLRLGYVRDRQKGSHIILRHRQPPHRRLTVPRHKALATPSKPAFGSARAGVTTNETSPALRTASRQWLITTCQSQ